mmetsp:Transcript_3941/g.10097  ORF Transcript_3941/g.10097 Transcript_3941/m.10097 type:complete len:208 (+) Transcript_3941:136-759(+)
MRQWWRTPSGEGALLGFGGASQFSRRIRPWYVMLLVLEVVLVVVRWRDGDAHGAILMLAVAAVGVLAVTVGSGGVDAIYGGYFGLMAFVGGLLDLNIAIEHIAFGWRHSPLGSPGRDKFDLEGLSKPALYLLCSASQLVASFLSYLLYKEVEVSEDGDDEPFFATPEQARIYHAAMRETERRHTSTPAQPMTPEDKAFMGKPYKLPP